MSIQCIASLTIPCVQNDFLNILSRSNFDDEYAYSDESPPYSEEISSRRRRRTESPSYRPRSTEPSILSIFQNPKQLGATLLALGLMLSFLGMILLFEKNLLRLGNICLLIGMVLLIGPGSVAGFFMKESRIQASIITALGIILVFWGKPRLGILIEIFGLLNLFGNMFPLLLALGRKTPIIGDIISLFDSTNNSPEGKGRKRSSDSRYTSEGRDDYIGDNSAEF